MRLRSALTACGGQVRAFDPAEGVWSAPLALEALLDEGGAAPGGGRLTHVKRAVFPQTLLESGRRASSALRAEHARPSWGRGDTVIVHTTYLGGLVPWLRSLGAVVIVDVYDLVWRAHGLDARNTRGPLGTTRALYAASVRIREERAMRAANGVLVVGFADWLAARRAVPGARFVPPAIPIPAGTRARRSPNGTIRVGLLGHFGHQPNRAAAEALLASPLAADSHVELVFAGRESDRSLPHRPRVRTLGPVDSVDEFYAEVDCVVAPSPSGAGLKIKLGEGILAGRPVLTTRLGAEGYPPELRTRFLVEDDPSALTAARCRAHIARFDPAEAADAFASVLGWDVAVESYRTAVEELHADAR